MSKLPSVTVVIPMRNAGPTIGGLATALLSAESLAVDIVAVDDLSTDDTVAVLKALRRPEVQVYGIRDRSGAGVARNLGFQHARGTYTLFFDADDEVNPSALVRAVDALERSGSDLAFLPYRYRRGHSTEFEGMNSYDRTVWSHYAAASQRAIGPDRTITLADVPRLLGFSNYPWNKVIRTDHYQNVGLRFGETPVHNDVLGHWSTLLEARSMVLVDEPLCTHIVAEGAGNLTNHRSGIRLSLFDALDETYSYLESRPSLRNRYSHHYWDFALRVSAWARGRIDPEHIDEFNVRLQHHLLRMNLVDFSRIRQRRDPALANRLVRRALA